MLAEAARRVVRDAIDARVFPAAAADVGDSTGTMMREAFGTLTFDAGSARTSIDTPFDLASLTKVIATTTLLMRLVTERTVGLDDPVSAFFEEWRGNDREAVAVRDLLEHASGLPARLVDAPPRGRREFEHEICTMPLEYSPRTRSIYSDLGFILLGFIAADRGHQSLASQLNDVTVGLPPSALHGSAQSRASDAADASVENAAVTFELPPDARKRAAPTLPMPDDARRGRMLVGQVHDNYAAALGGVAGHAGVFGSAPAVAAFAHIVLRAARGEAAVEPVTAAALAQFTRRSSVPASSRALGWDTMLPTSSCGTRMSPSAFGHVGFTGTSLWIDPARDRYFVLLTNRACGGGTLDEMRDVRRAFHDSLGDL
jgi:CubicO group peptidase (beta-lactamase class C family)